MTLKPIYLSDVRVETFISLLISDKLSDPS